MRCLISFLFFLIVLSSPVLVHANPVISEVMWMGSDQSTADEWLEIANPEAEDIDLSGWTITSVNSSGKEVISFRFATGAVIAAGEYLVIASKSAANSRLLAESFGVSSTLSLPNTKLLLRLRNAENTLIDEVDDGAGAPFAGDNPSGGGPKASMERLDVLAPGTLKENWVTSTLSVGFDDGSPIFGTPGFSFASDPPDDPPDEPPSCTDSLEIAIAIQSGLLAGVGKTTVNFQAVATAGSLSGVSCAWSYDDGFSSTSCNPPSHSFTQVGSFTVRLEAKNQCDITLIQEQIVQVLADPASPQNSSVQSTLYDGSKLIIIGALPNPVGTDTGKEWIEIKNLEDRAVDLRGWKLAVGETKLQSYILAGAIGPRETLRIYDSELKFKLPNTASKLQLMTPSGIALSSVPWKSTEEDRIYFPDDIRDLTVRGRVVKVTGPVTFILQLEPDASAILGDDTVNVRILGVNEKLDPVRKEKVGSFETLRALIENKNIELQFDTELWDDMGRLLGHVYIEGGILSETQMIISKLWVADTKSQYIKKQEFLDLEESLAPSQSELQPDSQTDFSAIRLALSEIYPSPFPVSQTMTDTDWKTQEWLEIENFNQKAVDLSGWKLKTAKSQKALPEGLKIASGSKLLIYTSSLKLSLRNAGDTVSLISPTGEIISSLEYPELKNGMAFAATENDFCETIQPTPGESNICVSPVKKTAATKAAARKITAAKKAAAKVKSYAASYRAQTDSTDSGSPVNLEISAREGHNWASIIFVFILGVACAVCGLLVAKKQGWILFRTISRLPQAEKLQDCGDFQKSVCEAAETVI